MLTHVVVGLGNPGKKYAGTRHNIGFRVLDSLRLNFSFEKKFNAEVAAAAGVLYCKPQTFMNDSGTAVRAVADYYKLTPQQIIAIYDDKDLPFGSVRVRTEGGSAGHNGVRSLIQHLGSEQFTRIRIGIATDSPIPDTADFVLANFTAEEEDQLTKIIAEAHVQLNKLL